MTAAPIVDFAVIGAMKAMTTSLLTTLAGHPGIAVSSIKETQYFVAETGHRLGPDWYRSLWSHAKPDQLRGEASPQYTFFPHYDGVPQRFAAEAAGAKVVYLVRDPVERTLSHYRHAVGRGVEARNLREAVLTDARYLLPSHYALQLDQWLRVVPDSDVLVVDAGELAAEPAKALARICAHVGADPALAPSELARENVADEIGRLRPVAARLGRMPKVRRVGRGLRRCAPAGAVRAWDRAVTLPNPRQEADDLLLAELREVLAADTSRLRRHLGGAAPAWAR